MLVSFVFLTFVFNTAMSCICSPKRPSLNGTEPPFDGCLSKDLYNSVYECPKEQPCVTFPTESVFNETQYTFGQKADLSCPADSFAYFELEGQHGEVVAWKEFKDKNFQCSDGNKWTVAMNRAHANVKTVACFRYGCGTCPPIPRGTKCPEGKKCGNPAVEEYKYHNGCRVIVLGCNAPTLSYLIDFKTGERETVPLKDWGTGTISCNGRGEWIRKSYDKDPGRVMTAIQCVD